MTHRRDLLNDGYTSRKTGTKEEVFAHLKRNAKRYNSYRTTRMRHGKWELYAK